MSTDDLQHSFTSPDGLVSFRDASSVLYASVQAKTITTIETPLIGNALSKAVKEAPDGLRCLVIDMEQVTMVNSSALGMFVTTYTTALHRNAKIILSGVTDTVLDILTVTRLNSMFTVCRTAGELESALRKM